VYSHCSDIRITSKFLKLEQVKDDISFATLNARKNACKLVKYVRKNYGLSWATNHEKLIDRLFFSHLTDRLKSYYLRLYIVDRD